MRFDAGMREPPDHEESGVGVALEKEEEEVNKKLSSQVLRLGYLGCLSF